MTRDEAIALAIKSKETWGGGSSEAWLVNALEALGLLKLDEPKSLDDKLVEALAREGYGFLKPETLRKSLESSGLKITEK